MPITTTINCDNPDCGADISDAALAANPDLRRFTSSFQIARGNMGSSVEFNDQGTHYFCSMDHLKAFLDTVLW